jgi:hypothetical protein
MVRMTHGILRACLLSATLACFAGCSGSDDSNPKGGSGGSATGGTAGTGAAGNGGSGGSSGGGGAAGSAVGGSSGSAGSGGSTAFAPSFPRLGSYAIGGPHNYDSAEYRNVAAKQHVVILSQWPGWQSGKSMTMAEVMQDIKAKSTVGTKTFIYVNNNEKQDPTASTDAAYPLYQKLNAEKWWLYDTGTSGTPVPRQV